MSNGDIDRKALQVPEARPEVGVYVAPVGQVETALARIWADVLQVERVGRHDNVFELGGFSLQAIKLVAAVNAHFGCRFRLRHVFEFPELLAMAAEISNLAACRT
jgi:hypothetical protein